MCAAVDQWIIYPLDNIHWKCFLVKLFDYFIFGESLLAVGFWMLLLEV